jgi:hypothetical protein
MERCEMLILEWPAIPDPTFVLLPIGLLLLPVVRILMKLLNGQVGAIDARSVGDVSGVSDGWDPRCIFKKHAPCRQPLADDTRL